MVLAGFPAKEFDCVFFYISNANQLNEIVLFNDEVNTFEHVIETLVHVCKHSYEQAEQCSLLVHYKGKCTVKTGVYEELEPQCTQLLKAGLSAEIV